MDVHMRGGGAGEGICCGMWVLVQRWVAEKNQSIIVNFLFRVAVLVSAALSAASAAVEIVAVMMDHLVLQDPPVVVLRVGKANEPNYYHHPTVWVLPVDNIVSYFVFIFLFSYMYYNALASPGRYLDHGVPCRIWERPSPTDSSSTKASWHHWYLSWSPFWWKNLAAIDTGKSNFFTPEYMHLWLYQVGNAAADLISVELDILHINIASFKASFAVIWWAFSTEIFMLSKGFPFDLESRREGIYDKLSGPVKWMRHGNLPGYKVVSFKENLFTFPLKMNFSVIWYVCIKWISEYRF